MEYSKIIILLGAIILVSAFPQGQQPVPILRDDRFYGLNGNYNFSYETGDGISKTEKGYVKDLGGDETAQVVEGEYRYTHPDGTIVSVKYVADEEGFRPTIYLAMKQSNKK